MKGYHFIGAVFVFVMVCIPVNVHNAFSGDVPVWMGVCLVVLNVVSAVVVLKAYRRERAK